MKSLEEKRKLIDDDWLHGKKAATKESKAKPKKKVLDKIKEFVKEAVKEQHDVES